MASGLRPQSSPEKEGGGQEDPSFSRLIKVYLPNPESSLQSPGLYKTVSWRGYGLAPPAGRGEEWKAGFQPRTVLSWQGIHAPTFFPALYALVAGEQGLTQTRKGPPSSSEGPPYP